MTTTIPANGRILRLRGFWASRAWWVVLIAAFVLPLAAALLLVKSAPIVPAFAYTLF